MKLSVLRKFAVVCTMLISMIVTTAIFPVDRVSASCGDNYRILGMPVWYRGLTEGETDCNIVSPSSLEDGEFIWTIVINIIEAVTILVGYVSFGFIIYGGFKYLISAGSASGIEQAKKTIFNAVIGLVISIIAVAVVNFIFDSLKGV